MSYQKGYEPWTLNNSWMEQAQALLLMELTYYVVPFLVMYVFFRVVTP